MDDDVEYLGTKQAGDDVQLLVTGITLHVDKCGDRPAHHLTFHRARSSSVNIGRKSGSDVRSMRRENDDHNAVFSCQVVSAKHAKLVLSDSGQVYIVDLHSRHGTHLTRRGETVSKMLQPETETLLADGDVLTFGKVVGAGSYHVSPVTVRVELLTGFSPSDPAQSPVRPRKLSSTGRYGLISASIMESDSPQSSSCLSVSSDAFSSPSEQESDVDVDADDEPACVPALLRDSQGTLSVKIPTFRNLIREMCHNTVLHSPAISDLPDEPLVDVADSPPSVDVVINPSPIAAPETLPKSRSPSPIDLIMSPPSRVHHLEPAVIGAWPASRPDSPHSSLEVEAAHSEVPLVPEPDREPDPIPAHPSPDPSRQTSLFVEMIRNLDPHPRPVPFMGFPPVPPPLPLPVPYHAPPCHPLDRVVTQRVNAEIKGSLKSVEDRMTALQVTLDDLKSRQTVTEEDVVDLQTHVEMLQPDSERLLCRITGAERNIAALSILQGQMAGLQNQVTTLRARMDVTEARPVETPMDDVRACADALNGLVSEMKTLREEVEKRIEAKMEVIQSARAEALDTLKEVVSEAESIRSLKRKRVDDEAEETLEVAVPVACSPPVVVDPPLSEVPVPQVPSPQVPVISVPTEVPVFDDPAPARPKKRARTAMYSVAHTAAAMAIGAAATWSALAFS